MSVLREESDFLGLHRDFGQDYDDSFSFGDSYTKQLLLFSSRSDLDW